MNYLKLIEALIADASAIEGAPIGGSVNVDQAALGLPAVSISVLGKVYSVDVAALVKRVS